MPLRKQSFYFLKLIIVVLELRFQIDTTAARRAQENKHIVGEIARAVLFCARQCIGLRGHYSANDASNPGNNF